MAASTGVQELDKAPIPRLQDRILRARHACRRAGLSSSRFIPIATGIKINVEVTVTLDKWDLSDDDMAMDIRRQLRERFSESQTPLVTIPPKRGPGRPRKSV